MHIYYLYMYKCVCSSHIGLPRENGSPDIHALPAAGHGLWQGVAGYRWATANDLEGRDPVSWAISYSTDCVNFVSF